MEPTLHTGDLALCVRPGPGDLRPGAIVVWYTSPVAGVIHRLVEVRDGYVITKGDANPGPDPPVPLRDVKYRVAAVIPRSIWAPLALALAGVASAWYRSTIVRALREPPGELVVASWVLGLLLAVTLGLEFLVEVPVYSEPPEIPRPSISLDRIVYGPPWLEARILYTSQGVSIQGIHSCLAYPSTAPGAPSRCQAFVLGNSTVLVRFTPAMGRELYRLARGPVSSIIVHLNLSVTHGFVYGVYRLPLNWQGLALSLNDTRLAISNPNPISFNVSVRVDYYNETGFGLSYTGSLALGNYTIGPGERLELDVPPRGDVARVVVGYDFKFAGGGRVVESRTLRLRG
jgi:signal peptidase I